MSEQTKAVMSTNFLNAFADLPRGIQRKVTQFLIKFLNNPNSPGINYEKINNAIDQKLFSVRIDDAYRGIVVREQGTGVYLLLWVDHHDEAYAWATRRRCEVNGKTSSVQLFEVQTITETTDNSNTLFKHVSDADLLKLGVPEAQLNYVRSFTDSEAFFQASGTMPKEAFDHLLWIVEEMPVSEVLELAKEECDSQTSSKTISEALQVPISQQSFFIVEGEDELLRIIAEPLEKWRIFLHPAQRKIVNRNYSGPARVLGGAGTGKTVVAMHRAKYLASKITGKEKILFTTFTANLAADIKENLRKICTVDELRKIEVINLDAWVNQFFRDSEFSAEVNYDNIPGMWEKAILLANVGLPFDARFYEDEWNRVVIAQEALSLDKYAKASRNGRGVRLNRKQRMLVWKVMETYQNLMKENQIRDINMAMYESRKLLETSGNAPRYAHVIVDEGQDFSDNAYQLIRTLAGEEHPNDLFIVGDSHQRIYRNRPTLSKCGINVRGRSSILKINYRTTEEIRKFAFSLLQGISFDDLDEGIDKGDRCHSLTHGTKPEVKEFKDASSEMSFIIDEIKNLRDAGVSLSNICLVARTKKLLSDYIDQLTHAGIKTYVIKRNKTEDRSMDGVRVATMHRVKGLEFQYVFVVAANNRVIPLASAIDKSDQISEEESLAAEKCLLYVALTRAQKGAYITSYGKKSEFLKDDSNG